MKRPVIHFGTKSYEIMFAEWDAANQVGLIQVRDMTDGEYHVIESDGIEVGEQRQAVADWAMARAAVQPIANFCR